MVKLTLTFKQLVSLVKTELQDNYSNFENDFALILSKKCKLIEMKLPSPVDYSSALLECIQQLTFPLSPTIRKLVSDFHDIASTFIIPNKHDLNTKISPKANKLTNQYVGNKIIEPSVSKGKPTAPKTSCSTQLSAKKTKLFKKFIEDQKSQDCKLYSSCKTSPCKEVCPKLVRITPLTACTHKNPHPGGFYPHLTRKIVRKVHQFKDYTAVLTMKGIPNPLNEQSSAAGGSTEVTAMECSVEKPAPTTTPGSKKRKLDEHTDSEWSWVGNALRANSEFAVLQNITTLLAKLDAPAELRKAVLKWNTLSEADKKMV